MKRSPKFSFPYLLCLIVLALFTQCKKEHTTPPVDYLPQEFKDWMFFKEGTYWVYQDSVTGQLDSTVVTLSGADVQVYRDDYGDIIKQTEQLYYQTYSFRTGETFKYISSDRCRWPNPDYPNETCLYVNRGLVINGREGGSDGLLFYTWQAGTGLSYMFLKARYDSLQIAGRYYKDVAVNWQPAYNTAGGQVESWYYLAKGVGIVQTRQKYQGKNTTRKLLRYHMKQ